MNYEKGFWRKVKNFYVNIFSVLSNYQKNK